MLAMAVSNYIIFFLNLIIFSPGFEPATVNLVSFCMVGFFGVFVFLAFWLVGCCFLVVCY